MTAALVVDICAPGASLQDMGRTGWRRHGISTTGAMDRLALAVANVLAGNPPGTAALELTLAGARFHLTGGPALLAASGPGVTLRISGRAVAEGRSARAEPGDSIDVSAPRGGVHGYLAVGGGFALFPIMGSLSTHLRSGLGPPMLAPGQSLPLRGGAALLPRALDRLPAHDSGPIRILPGPQDDWFPPGSLDMLTGAEWHIGARSDRMGRFLDGPAIPPLPGSMVSDGIVQGGIQVPPAGQPIVLMRDCQTTGGYPRLATVISADIDRLAQLPPGAALRFVQVDRAAAVAAAIRHAQRITALDARPVPEVDAARLLSVNLVSGVVDARAPAPDPD
ncbi:MAG TPA: biotin-dependent carboxyltransferase family protein [Paracoccaceae bacterium]|nr:biotin-dependent carboxyltransferase family protein [Paracoccaceae bacterium]